MVIVQLNDNVVLPENEVVKFQLFVTDEVDPKRILPIYYKPHELGRLMFTSLENPFHLSGVV